MNDLKSILRRNHDNLLKDAAGLLSLIAMLVAALSLPGLY